MQRSTIALGGHGIIWLSWEETLAAKKKKKSALCAWHLQIFHSVLFLYIVKILAMNMNMRKTTVLNVIVAQVRFFIFSTCVISKLK